MRGWGDVEAIATVPGFARGDQVGRDALRDVVKGHSRGQLFVVVEESLVGFEHESAVGDFVGEGGFVRGSRGYGAAVDAEDHVTDCAVGGGEKRGRDGDFVEGVEDCGLVGVGVVAQKGKREVGGDFHLDAAVDVGVGIGQIVAIGLYEGWGLCWLVEVDLIVDIRE